MDVPTKSLTGIGMTTEAVQGNIETNVAPGWTVIYKPGYGPDGKIPTDPEPVVIPSLPVQKNKDWVLPTVLIVSISLIVLMILKKD